MDPTEAKFRAENINLAAKMTDQSLFGTPEMVKLAKRQAEITPLIDLYDQRIKLEKDLSQSQKLLYDPEMAELAREDIPHLEQQLTDTNDKLRLALVPKDPNDPKNAIIEIRAGAGGDEASLFGAELYRMY